MRVFVDLADNFEEREESHVGDLAVLEADIHVFDIFVCLIFELIRLFVLPHKEEGLADVFVGTASSFVTIRMCNLGDHIHESHDLGL